MPYYESVFIARPDISQQQVNGLTEQFSNIITENGGTVAKTEYWGLRNLAYRIKKNRKGHYVMLHLDASADALAEMERNIRLNEDVMRLLTIRVDELEEGPSVVMQARNSRDSRDGREGRDSRGPRENRGPRQDRDASPAQSEDTSAAASDGE